MTRRRPRCESQASRVALRLGGALPLSRPKSPPKSTPSPASSSAPIARIEPRKPFLRGRAGVAAGVTAGGGVEGLGAGTAKPWGTSGGSVFRRIRRNLTTARATLVVSPSDWCAATWSGSRRADERRCTPSRLRCRRSADGFLVGSASRALPLRCALRCADRWAILSVSASASFCSVFRLTRTGGSPEPTEGVSCAAGASSGTGAGASPGVSCAAGASSGTGAGASPEPTPNHGSRERRCWRRIALGERRLLVVALAGAPAGDTSGSSGCSNTSTESR